MNSLNQKTINKPIRLCGVGLHNGVKANVVIKPAEANSGINFCRVDVDRNEFLYSMIILISCCSFSL